MAIVLPPSYLQNVATHSAITDRMAANGAITGISATVLRGRGGVHSGAGGKFDVQQRPSPDMNVRVKSGLAWVPGTASDAKQGMYSVMNDNDVDLAIGASSPTLNRYDIVYVQVRDAVYAGSDNDALLAVAAGTPASGTPAEPSIPASSLALARVFIGAGVTSIVTANIDKKAIWAGSLGGEISADSTNMPLATDYPDGQLLWQRDIAGKKLFINKTAVWTRIFTIDDGPQGEIGYAQITASSSAIINSASPVDIPSLAVTVNVTAGRKYKIEIEGGVACPTAPNHRFIMLIRESTTTLRVGGAIECAAQNLGYPAQLNYRFIAAATASRTFKVSAVRNSGADAGIAVASATAPFYIRVIDQGI